ncbi:MAG: GSU2403 family nucleotidyltransferase fold protein [candidate division FCPU426 bacterium]
MPELERLERQFLAALAALGDAREQLVVVGGWCPFLYAKYLWHRSLPSIPTTLDIDLGVMETGPARFPSTVFDSLKRQGFAMERLYAGEEEPIEFVSKRGVVELKIEFITSFLTSDDTLNRFLGKSLACNRIDAFEILLADPILLDIPHARKRMRVRAAEPGSFMFHKGISFVMRSDEYKLEKDLFYLYFIWRHHPDRPDLIRRLRQHARHELFDNFRQNVTEYLADAGRPGYAILRKFLGASADPRSINKEIKEDLDALFQALD